MLDAMTDSSREAVELARSAGSARRLLTLAVVLLALALAAERLGYAGVYRGAATPGALMAQLVFAGPALLYLAALWRLRSAAAAVAAGAPFGAEVVGALRQTGARLIAGALLSLAMPLAHAALQAAFPRLIELDTATLILAAIGGGLIFLSRIVARAAALETELDAFF
jgi:hypothetical protein